MKNLPDNVLLRSFVRLAREEPDHPLAVSPAGVSTRGDIAGAARALAEVLADERGLEGGLVLLRAPNGSAFFAGLLAAWMRGAVPVLADASSPDAALAGMAARFDARAVLTCGEGRSLEAHAWSVVRSSTHGRGDVPPGVVKLTSGSTGQAKGAFVPAESLAADDRQIRAGMGIARDERLLVAIPLSHSYGLGSLVAPALSVGSTLVFPDPDAGLFGPLEAARAAGAAVFPTVPAYLRALLDLPRAPAWPETLRLVITAGAPLPPETARRFRERFGRRVHVFYGSSETGGIAFDVRGDAGERGLVGEPLPGVEVELEGAHDQPGEGRVIVRSPALATGYLPVEDARLDGGRFATSDLACREGRELRLLGRLDDVVNVRGKKVDPLEVARVLETHPRVNEAVVIGVDDPASGTQRLRAVVASREAGLRYRELADWCRARLAPHQVPRGIVVVERLPRTERGKVDRGALAKIARDSR